MINKQRVQRIRNFLYTCILLVVFVPIILMLVVSFRTLRVLTSLDRYFAQNPPAVTETAPVEPDDGYVLGPGSLSAPDVQEQSLDPQDEPEIEPQQGEADNDRAVQAEPDSIAENGRYVANQYLPVSYPGLYFDTVPLVPLPAPSSENTLYLTFDNTPSSQAGDILAVLDRHGVKATFFVWWNDSTPAANGDFYRGLVASGHQIGIHSAGSDTTYAQLYASVDSFLAEYDKIFRIIHEQTGVKPRLYRLPGGSVNPYNPARQRLLADIKAELDARGFLQYDWTASAQDAVAPALTKAQVLRNIEATISDDGRVVILLHDGTGSPSTAQALDDFIRQYKADGYSFGVLEYDAEPVSFLGPDAS